jgi:hypothetical protein
LIAMALERTRDVAIGPSGERDGLTVDLAPHGRSGGAAER